MDITAALDIATVDRVTTGNRATFEHFGELARGFGDTPEAALDDLRVTLEFNLRHNGSLT